MSVKHPLSQCNEFTKIEISYDKVLIDDGFWFLRNDKRMIHIVDPW